MVQMAWHGHHPIRSHRCWSFRFPLGMLRQSLLARMTSIKEFGMISFQTSSFFRELLSMQAYLYRLNIFFWLADVLVTLFRPQLIDIYFMGMDNNTNSKFS